MLPPEVIDKLTREKEVPDRPVLWLPVPSPDEASPREGDDEDERTGSSRIIVIDL